MFLVDAAVVQNAVASASVASSPTPIFAHAPVSALSELMSLAAGLKTLGLTLIDNTHLHFPVAVSSPSSLSSGSNYVFSFYCCPF